jgi:hypothetical protein
MGKVLEQPKQFFFEKKNQKTFPRFALQLGLA